MTAIIVPQPVVHTPDSDPRLVIELREEGTASAVATIDSGRVPAEIDVRGTKAPVDSDLRAELEAVLGAEPAGALSLTTLVALYGWVARTGQDVPGLGDVDPRTLTTGLALPRAVEGTPYPYQQVGYEWLAAMSSIDRGAILADEMGLGKTLQVILLLAMEVERHGVGNNLVIAPPSLLENWRREIVRFAPGLRVAVHRGSDRPRFLRALDEPDVVVVSYDTLVRDVRLFARVEWNIVALDEAQSVKNPDTARRQAVAKLDARMCICVSGTPVENSLVDLWSLTDLAEPGLLGPLDRFKARFDDTEVSAETLEPIVRPLMLRRRVRDVAEDLPPLIEIPNILEMHPAEATAYEHERTRRHADGRPIAALAKLQHLRMFSAHPWLRDTQTRSGDPSKTSAKYERLVELLEQIFANGERALVFGAFNKLLDISRRDLTGRFHVPVESIDGRVPVEVRQPIIDRFQAERGPAALLLGPRAAGVGLNITNANHVIHHTLEWNPAIEDQATARAWRRGQELPVTLHRLIYADTVDEVMNDRIQRKRGIAAAVVDRRAAEEHDAADLERAVAISPMASSERNRNEDQMYATSPESEDRSE